MCVCVNIYMYIPYTHSVPDDSNIINLIDSTGWFYFFTFFKYIYISRLWVRKKTRKDIYRRRVSIAYIYMCECVRRAYTAHIKEVQFSGRLSCKPIVRYIVRAFVFLVYVYISNVYSFYIRFLSPIALSRVYYCGGVVYI